MTSDDSNSTDNNNDNNNSDTNGSTITVNNTNTSKYGTTTTTTTKAYQQTQTPRPQKQLQLDNNNNKDSDTNDDDHVTALEKKTSTNHHHNIYNKNDNDDTTNNTNITNSNGAADFIVDNKNNNMIIDICGNNNKNHHGLLIQLHYNNDSDNNINDNTRNDTKHRTEDINTNTALPSVSSSSSSSVSSSSSSSSSFVTIVSIPDQQYEYIHPNCYAPASLEHVQYLHGGGSGTAVFGGTLVLPSSSLSISSSSSSVPSSTKNDDDAYTPSTTKTKRIPVVMKHGGPKDTKEVFSLATITKELIQRKQFFMKNNSTVTISANNMDRNYPDHPDHQQQTTTELNADVGTTTTTITTTTTRYEKAFDRMKQRIPEFIGVYISRHHLRDRGKEVWYSIRSLTYSPSGTRLSIISSSSTRSLLSPSTTTSGGGGVRMSCSTPSSSRSLLSAVQANNNNKNNNISNNNTRISTDTKQSGLTDSELRILSHLPAPPAKHPPVRTIQMIYEPELNQLFQQQQQEQQRYSSTPTVSSIHWDVDPKQVVIHVPAVYKNVIRTVHNDHCDDEDATGGISTRHHHGTKDSFEFIRDFGNELQKQEEHHEWKVTLIQKKIGGAKSINGADVLLRGHFHDRKLLQTLINEFTQVMKDLDVLTLPNERCDNYQNILREIDELRETKNIRNVSKTLDRFVGCAILKNFHPVNGRFTNLRLVGEDLIDNVLTLTDAEQISANFLGKLLQPNVSLYDIFIDPPASRMALDIVEEDGWFDIIEAATNFHNPTSFHAATDCLWTCGLTDAGLHNCFLSVERGLEMFDLGEPTLEPRPAFLTKFLMSFFHTLGMETDSHSGIWKNRFDIVKNPTDDTGRLQITSETSEKIPYLIQVFNITVDHLIENIFYNEEKVRSLMLRYVVLQLLSDASFCLRRWESKGGGSERVGERKNEPLEKWLWRSIWDCYIASYVQSKLLSQI